MPRKPLMFADSASNADRCLFLTCLAGLTRLCVSGLVLAVFLAGRPAYCQDPATPAAATEAASGEAGAGGAPAAPGSAPGGQPISFAGSQVPIERALDVISRASGYNVVARGKASGQQVSLLLRNVTLDEAIQKVVNQKPDFLVYKPEGQPRSIEIWDQATYKQEILPKLVRQKVFVPVNITAEDAAKAITGILTPNIGTIAFDARSNKVIVTDQPYVLEIAQRLLEQIDVDYLTRVFYITHADVNEIAEKLTALRSPLAPAADVDVRTHQIIVRDRLENILKMELLIETLDVGPDIRVYDLNSIGIEGIDSEVLVEALEQIITPEAFYQVNLRASKLILEDIPEVHEKVEKLLASLDQPVKQVLIQAEIIETAFAEGFNHSIDYVFSRDLFSAVIDGLTGLSGLPTGPGGATVGDGAATAGTGANAFSGFEGIPVSLRRGASVDNGDLGFIDFRKEFPITRLGSGGIDTRILTKNAFISLNAAMSDSRTRVLQQPRVTVKNQTMAMFTVGREIPYFTGGSVYGGTTTGTGGQVVQQAGQPVQQRLRVGITLEVTPVISNNGLIELEVILSNDEPIIETVQFANQNYTGVGSTTQEIETTLVIPSGETRVIGGLLSDKKAVNRQGIPGLVKIPVIGPWLFGSEDRPSDDNNRRNLLIFLTPTIVEENPRPPVAFKGRSFEEGDVAFLSTPEGTVTDVDIEPIPLGVESNIPAMPGKAPYDPAEVPSAAESGMVTIDPLAGRSADPGPSTILSEPDAELGAGMTGSAGAVSLDTVDADAGGEMELRRIRITDRPDTTPQVVSRIPAVVPGLTTGVGIGTPAAVTVGGRPGPGGVVTAPGGVVPGPGGVAVALPPGGLPPGVQVDGGRAGAPGVVPAVVTPLATPAAATGVAPTVTSTVPTPVAPPQPETRF